MGSTRTLARTTRRIRSVGYGLKFVLRHGLGLAQQPLIRGIVLSNRCNLRCRQCTLRERGWHDLDYPEAVAAIDAYYGAGGRCLYFEGGEPFLWRDGDHDLESLVGYAHTRGYLTVVVYTNGTFPLRSSADTLFVSMDGLQETHDALRGKSFDTILKHIEASRHPSLFINYTVNTLNKEELRAFCRMSQALPQIRGVFFYVHTPYYGHDELCLTQDEKQRVLTELLAMKKEFRILNSRAGLRSALRNDWRRPMGVCSVYEKGHIYECCRYSSDPELCRECGYLSYPEIDQTLKLKPSAILNALQYF